MPERIQNTCRIERQIACQNITPVECQEKMPDRMSEHIGHRMPEKMSQYIPDRMPEKTTDRMSEYMPGEMPEENVRIYVG